MKGKSKFSMIDKGINRIVSDKSRNKEYKDDDRRLHMNFGMNSKPTNWPKMKWSNYSSYSGLNYDNIEEEKVTKNKVSYAAGKKIINKAPGQKFPSVKVIGKVYATIPDDKKVPVVLETKKQYLNEYISNQEKKRKMKFSREEKERYLRSEMEKLKPVTSRFTTYHNKYMPPRVVLFPGNKSFKEAKENIIHEYGHELEEKDKSLNKEWRQKINPRTSPTVYGTTDKSEDLAESIALYKCRDPSKINNPKTNPNEIKKRFHIISKHVKPDSSKNMMDYGSSEEMFKQQNNMYEQDIRNKVFAPKDYGVSPDSDVVSVNYLRLPPKGLPREANVRAFVRNDNPNDIYLGNIPYAERQIDTTSKIIAHEEMHNFLNKEHGLLTARKFDNIQDGPIYTDNKKKVLNPRTAFIIQSNKKTSEEYNTFLKEKGVSKKDLEKNPELYNKTIQEWDGQHEKEYWTPESDDTSQNFSDQFNLGSFPNDVEGGGFHPSPSVPPSKKKSSPYSTLPQRPMMYGRVR